MHPLQAEFVVPESQRREDGTEVTYRLPESEEVDRYENETYPGWLSECRSILEGLHQDRVEMEPSLTLTWGIANEGTRPAVQVRVAFVAEGDIRLCRRSAGDEDESDGRDTNEETARHPLRRLPRPPKPPQLQRIVKRPKAGSGRPDAATARANLSALRIGDLSRFASAGTALSDLTRTASLIGRERALRGTVLGGLAEPKLVGVVHPLEIAPLPELILPTRNDKVAFYYDDWPLDEPVRIGALTCDLYRHQNGEVLFEVDAVFPPDGDVWGAIVCTVHAENLTEPVSVRIAVSRCIEKYPVLEQAQALVDSCGHRTNGQE